MSEPVANKDERAAQVYRDPIAMVNAYLARFGDDVGAEFDELDSDGYIDIRHGDLRLGINVLHKSDVLLLLVRVTDCPEDPHQAMAVYRQLLEFNFLSTQGCAFAIDQASDAVYLRAMRGLSGLGYTEFRELVESTVAVAEDLGKRLLPVE